MYIIKKYCPNSYKEWNKKLLVESFNHTIQSISVLFLVSLSLGTMSHLFTVNS